MTEDREYSRHLSSLRSSSHGIWVWLTKHPDANAQSPSATYLVPYQLLGELEELLVLFGMIAFAATETRALDEHWHSLRGQPTAPGDMQQAINAILGQRSGSVRRLAVLLKAVYEWVYHLREILDQDAKLSMMCPREIRAELNRYCTFRNHLIAHKVHLKGPSAGLLYSNNLQRFELLMAPFHLPSGAVDRIQAVFSSAGAFLTNEQAKEENAYERLELLYDNLQRLPGDLQAHVKRLLKEFGTKSDSPVEVLRGVSSFATWLVGVLGQSPMSPGHVLDR